MKNKNMEEDDMGWARNEYTIIVDKPEGKRQPWRPRIR
jgi:hypothetical protein